MYSDSITLYNASYFNKFFMHQGKANISGSSELYLTFINSLNVNIYGASELKYSTENGHLDINESSSCRVIKVD